MSLTDTEFGEGGSGLIIRLADGTELPLVIGPAGAKKLTGDHRSERAVRNDCTAGIIPTLRRGGGSGAHHRIPTAKLLDSLGVPYDIAASS